VRLHGFVQEFGEKYFTTDRKILLWKLREVKVTAEKHFTVQQHCNTAKHFTVQQHCNTAKHKSCVNREFAAESRQRLLFQKSQQFIYIGQCI
jgi:hypothetical protein